MTGSCKRLEESINTILYYSCIDTECEIDTHMSASGQQLITQCQSLKAGTFVDEKGTLYEGEWRYGSELSQCDSM